MAIWDDIKTDNEIPDPFGSVTGVATQAKCPNCASNIYFDANLTMLACRNCGGVFVPETLEQSGNLKTRDTEAADINDSRTEYVCDSCGAVVVTDNTTAASFCAFCGSPAILKKRLANEFRPDYIIPFKVDKKGAIDIFWNWVKKNKYVPRNFINEESLGKITGLYVPFWLIDAKCHTVISGSGQSGCAVFNLDRQIDFATKMVPFDGSSKISNLLMEAVEPYDYEEMIPYNDLYLQGFYAQRYDEAPFDMTDRIQSRMDAHARQLGKKLSIGEYDKVNINTSFSYSSDYKQHYALLPVWFLRYEYEGLRYTFVVNGQTGEPAGDLPYSPVKRAFLVTFEVVKWVALALAVFSLIMFIFYKSIAIDASAATMVIYYLTLLMAAAAGTFVSWFVRRVTKVKYDSMNPIDSAPEVERYLDLSQKIDMQKHDKFGYMKEAADRDDDDDNRNGLVKYMMRRGFRIR